MSLSFSVPEDFGPVGTSDDSSTLQAWLDSGELLAINPGVYNIASTLHIGNGTSTSISLKNGYSITGRTSGTSSAETAPSIMPVRIKWTGPLGGTMLSIEGPVVGVDLSGICFDCNDLANTAIASKHMIASTWRDILATRYRNAAFVLESWPVFSGMVQGANKNTFTNIRALSPGSGGCGIRVGNRSATTSDILDVAQNQFVNCDFGRDGLTATTYSLWLGFCDSCTFIGSQVHAMSGTQGAGIYIKPPTGTGMSGFPDEILFINCPTMQGVVADGSWTPARGFIFDPYPIGDGEPIPTSPYIRGRTFDNKFFGGLSIGSGGVQINSIIIGSITYDPPSLANGSGATMTFTVTGAQMGDTVMPSFSNNLQGIMMTAYVSAANTVAVRFQNQTGNTLNLSSGTVKAVVVQ